MSTKHTPAQVRAWLADTLIQSSKCEEIDTGDAIEMIGFAHDTIGELMASQSALLAALERISRACEPGIDQSDDELEAFIANVRRIARAAIAKAVQS